MVYQEGAGVVPMETIISQGEHQHVHAGDEKDNHAEHSLTDTITVSPGAETGICMTMVFSLEEFQP